MTLGGASRSYILRCSDDSPYIGETDDVPGRMARTQEEEGSADCEKYPTRA